MDSDFVRGIDRRRLLRWGGLATAGVAAAGAQLVDTPPVHADSAPTDLKAIPPDTRPGGAYDRYVAKLAAEDKFSGVVLLSHRGRTVLSRSYGMADKEKEIRNHEGVAFNLSSAGKPFGAVAILQLAQQGKVTLSDSVGTHLTGFAKEIAEKVTIHHLLSGTSGLNTPQEDLQRVFQSRDEVHEFYERWARQSELVAAPGTPTDHAGAEVAIPALIVEAVTGMTYWDYVEEHIFGRCGMTGTAFYTRPQWLTDKHIAHSYMRQADGSRVDAVRNLDKGSPDPYQLGKNPGRYFIDPPGDGGFATAPDLVRFAHALGDGTVLDRPYAELLTGAKIPLAPQGGGLAGQAAPADASFAAYMMPVNLIKGQWVNGRAGVNPGSFASWNIYPATGWVGVILGNYDDVPFPEIIQQEMQAIMG
ncbi:serine hydrolase domain-containing protein [Streptomyces zagrosensis]|uniref:CubicO group peptidase (Beta-lactamase class C family) n=1 Tax=Streptomyces zagrosensis TaxID=1042984 RepID=A0A7W9V1V6_9ACTN|nr:serine hydrolase domain-containing protein [Streptomyces zagrosensis]MBB5939693.1 CubicO group peptidase (beta-lactamase class C family) [Streptomyces zagrosensis]